MKGESTRDGFGAVVVAEPADVFIGVIGCWLLGKPRDDGSQVLAVAVAAAAAAAAAEHGEQ